MSAIIANTTIDVVGLWRRLCRDPTLGSGSGVGEQFELDVVRVPEDQDVRTWDRVRLVDRRVRDRRVGQALGPAIELGAVGDGERQMVQADSGLVERTAVVVPV